MPSGWVVLAELGIADQRIHIHPKNPAIFIRAVQFWHSWCVCGVAVACVAVKVRFFPSWGLPGGLAPK